MVTTRRRCTIACPCAKHLSYSPRPRCHNFLRSVDSDLFACSDSRNGWCSIPTEARGRGLTAFERTWTRAEVGRGRASTVARPATVPGSAGGLAATLHIGWIYGATAIGGGTARCRACRCCYTDAYRISMRPFERYWCLV
jgi:hypothetical protein